MILLVLSQVITCVKIYQILRRLGLDNKMSCQIVNDIILTEVLLNETNEFFLCFGLGLLKIKSFV